jgi:tRNA threonylcarbamoyladenosine biosynthesis protein TsaE
MTEAQLTTFSEVGTRALGRAIGANAKPGDVVLLFGELGTGKTCMVRGMATGLGAADNTFSPSFVLVREYKGRLTLYHMDFYRLEHTEEIADLGIEDYLDSDGVCAIEWAERAISLLPTDHMALDLTYNTEAPDTRTIHIAAKGARYEDLLRQLAQYPEEDMRWS